MVKFIFSQVYLVSWCEQNWSSYSFVHNKVWKWLTSDQIVDLMYIFTNIKLLKEWPNAIPTTWYKKNMLLEDLMFDVNPNTNNKDEDDFKSDIMDGLDKHEFGEVHTIDDIFGDTNNSALELGQWY